ncbi:hypothetical protein ACJD0Z_15625 [Flavobacteriaceae bacterium M23B6Z8]
MQNINYRLKVFFSILLLQLVLVSCEKETRETDDYQIITSILNASFSKETDQENRKFCENSDASYGSLLLEQETTLKPDIYRAIENHIKNEQLTDFSITDFKTSTFWDIKKITGYQRYRLKAFTSQSLTAPYIGKLKTSNISYNPTFDKALVYVAFYCSDDSHCGFSTLYQLKKEEKWIFEKETILSVF